ncbi:tetratricopeptide repeat protein [Undibacterium sp. Tian12W]|uniref:tetratricopeptide repeat protein n=1 Tax=Undibacterium sp. Tian12W TaxID=3413054 RepID=UPI003BF1BB47
MSNKILSIKDPEFKALVKQKTKLWRELDNSRTKHAGTDCIQDQWGTYVPMERVRKLLDVMDQLVEVDNGDESRGGRYSRAALLLSLNYLDEAETEFKLLVAQDPEEPLLNRELVVIAARRGDFVEAIKIAAILNTSPNKSYHLSENNIIEEYESHKRLTRPRSVFDWKR